MESEKFLDRMLVAWYILSSLLFISFIYACVVEFTQKSTNDEQVIIERAIKEDATSHVLCWELMELLSNKRLLNTQNEAESFVVAMNECFNFVTTKDLSNIYDK